MCYHSFIRSIAHWVLIEKREISEELHNKLEDACQVIVVGCLEQFHHDYLIDRFFSSY
jgi:hypothetical protein